MNNDTEDTQNRWQRIYDAQYREKVHKATELSDLINETEFRELAGRNGNTTIEAYERLLIRNGYAYRHPRTYERIIGHYKSTREEIRLIQKLQPCVPYAQMRNRSIGVRFKKTQDINRRMEQFKNGDKRIKATQTIGRKTGQFKTVWYSRHDRRK